MELNLQSLFGSMCTVQLYPLAEIPQPLPHLGSNTRTLVSQDRRHLFLIPWLHSLYLASVEIPCKAHSYSEDLRYSLWSPSYSLRVWFTAASIAGLRASEKQIISWRRYKYVTGAFTPFQEKMKVGTRYGTLISNQLWCGSGSALILVGWIRIQEGKKWPTKKKKVKKFHVFKCWMLSVEGWRLLLYFGRPPWKPIF